ncbi:MATE family efflux transporter [Pseudonocardia yuanmonensis]|uniref:MATE family efflux transporter n=1 Tax=Pseudonocardia yuanmonensis TaxID=1095914 RepID=UPI0031ECB059
MSSSDHEGVPARQVLRLAAQALPVLAAEPLYVLVDTAVVGRLGAVPLAGLAVAGVLFAQVTTALNFLSYGTTARSARLHGANRRPEAVVEGVQATWVALAVGLLVLGVGQLVARPVANALGDGGAVADAAVGWLRIALFGAPLILVTLAGNGWMRGVQDTARPLRYVLAGNGLSAVLCPVLVHGLGWGLEGSAVANVAAQVVVAGLFLAALAREKRAHPEVSLRPRPALIRAQLSMGRDLILRTAGFQVCFLSATAVAARFGASSVAAHQVVLQLWNFQALVLDAVAIAAQALVGAALGGGGAERAKSVAAQVIRYGLVLGVGFALLFAALYPVLPGVFTGDRATLDTIPQAWWFFVALQPVAGVVFAIDGVLLGAGDAAFLRTTTLLAAVGGFLPLIWISLVAGWGLIGIWTGLSLFMLIRFVAVGLRTRSGRWAVPGAVLGPESSRQAG